MKHIIILGATSGIGKALAETLASRGVRIGAAGRNEKALAQLEAAYPGLVVTRAIDINKPDAPGLLAKLASDLGGMDIYIHCAGIGVPNPELNPDAEAAVAETNAVGFARMTSAAYGIMRKHAAVEMEAGRNWRGQIVGISSVAGTKGIGELAAYSAAKAFDSTYLEALDQLAHMHRVPVTFTDIRPGWVRTPLIVEGHHYPMLMETDEVVALILKAIVRRKRVQVIDWRWNLAVGLWRLVPGWLWVRVPYNIGI